MVAGITGGDLSQFPFFAQIWDILLKYNLHIINAPFYLPVVKFASN
jgi:hypothetical protein